MKVLETIVDKADEGFLALIGKVITVWCIDYIWTGKLVGVNEHQIKLENAKLVFETGPFNTKDWKDAQAVPNPVYIRLSAISTYTILK